MRSEPEVRAALRTWVTRFGREVDGAALRDDTPLLRDRLLTSIQAPELILYIEHLRGEPVDVLQLQPGDLDDIDAIYRVFFAEARP